MNTDKENGRDVGGKRGMSLPGASADAIGATLMALLLLCGYTNTVGEFSGGAGNDNVMGSLAKDTINAGAGNDQVFGLGEDDVILGQAGNDVLDGGRAMTA